MNQFDKQILSLAIPSIVQNVTVPLLGLVDLTIVGHFGSASALGAIAVGSMIFNVVYWLLGFLRMGTSGLTSQAYGREDLADVCRLQLRSLTLALGIGMSLVLLQWPVRWLALSVIHPSAAVWPLAALYFDICIWGAPAMLGLFSLNGWFIGSQDTRTPLFVAVSQNLVNIVASLTLVYVFKLGIVGVASGTLIAQWFGFLFSLAVAWRRRRKLLQGIRAVGTVKSRPTSWLKFFRTNRDIFIRTLFLVAVNLAFTSIGAREGDVVLSVNTLLLTLYTFFSYMMDGFAFAAEALCGNYYGGSNRRAFRQVVNRLFVWGWSMVALFTLTYAVGGMSLMRFMTSSADVLALVSAYLPWALFIPLVGMAAFVYDGIFIGITATRGMLCSSAVSAVLFFVVFGVGVALRLPANHMLWCAFLVYLAGRGVVQCVWMRLRVDRAWR